MSVKVCLAPALYIVRAGRLWGRQEEADREGEAQQGRQGQDCPDWEAAQHTEDLLQVVDTRRQLYISDKYYNCPVQTLVQMH